MMDDFLAGFGKTLSRINLYSLQHPLVQESVKESFDGLSAVMAEEPEITLASSDGKLLVNGVIAGGPASIQQSLVQFFEKNQLYSISFKRGLTQEEMTSFYKLFTGKREDLKSPEDFTKFLDGEKVTHIAVNTAFFSKVGEKGDGSGGSGGGGGSGTRAPGTGGFGGEGGAGKGGTGKGNSLAQKMEKMTLDSMLWEVINQAVPDAEDQKKIYEIIFRQIQSELTQQIESATSVLRVEKQTLTNEKDRIESVIQTIAEGVVMVDNEVSIIMMNPVAEKIYGKNLSDLKGKKIQELAGEEVMISFAKEFTSPGDRPINKEVLIQSTLNTQRTVKQSTAMIENVEGRVVGMMSILTDIAKQRELREAQDQFLHNVTHELRSPLTAIKASLATLATDTDAKLSPAHRNLLAIANRNIDRLARMVNDILDFAKISEGHVSLSVRPVDAGKLIQDVITSLQSWAQSKQISLAFAPSGALPRVMADADRVVQVLVNLLSNAIKFTPKDGKIALRTEASPLMLKILVTDTGPGISKKDQEKIFQKFFQMKQTVKMDTPGTGLGLFITKKIVEMHQGEIGFLSEEGRGTTFWFTLPVVPESAPKEAAADVAPQKKKRWFSRLFGR